MQLGSAWLYLSINPNDGGAGLNTCSCFLQGLGIISGTCSDQISSAHPA